MEHVQVSLTLIIRLPYRVALRQRNSRPDALDERSRYRHGCQADSATILRGLSSARYKTVVNTSYQLRSKLGVRCLLELILKVTELSSGRT